MSAAAAAAPRSLTSVVALDRLGRSLSGIVRTVETLQQRGIVIRSLREGIDYSTPVGRMVAGIFASLAEYERTLIAERATAAREAARARGRQVGASGSLVEPRCYLAFGIAGATQHLQGIARCERVLAINTDLHADMVKRADLAIIADAQEVMPALTRLAREKLGGRDAS